MWGKKSSDKLIFFSVFVRFKLILIIIFFFRFKNVSSINWVVPVQACRGRQCDSESVIKPC